MTRRTLVRALVWTPVTVAALAANLYFLLTY